MSYKLGTHNSMTYLKPKQWFLWPFKWMAQCQSRDYKYQYDAGVRYFDIRVRFAEDTDEITPEFAHGLISYKADVEQVLADLNSRGEKIQIRLLLELASDLNQDGYQETCFIKKCQQWEKEYTNLIFHCGRRKYDWKVIYDFKNPEPSIDQKVSSMLGKKWDDIFPWVWSRLYNKKFLKEGTDKEYLLLDYIHIK